MAKKKTSTAAATVDPAHIELAKKLISEAPFELRVSRAKVFLKNEFAKLGVTVTSGGANAVALKLLDEDFLGSKRPDPSSWDVHYFHSPAAPTALAVVRGARRLDNFSLSIPDDSNADVETPEGILFPEDVYEVVKTDAGFWRTRRLVKKARRSWVCKYMFSNGRFAVFRPVSPFFPMEFSVPRSSLPKDFSEGEAVRFTYADDSCEWRYEGKIGSLNDPLGEMKIAAENYGVPIEFSPQTLREAEALPEAVDAESYQRRVDLTDIAFVTIDGEDARDFDDAVYCEETEDGWRLLVAIADVSHYVVPGSALDADAQKRGTSVYFAASVVPMLPEKLSNGLCSLNPGVDRLTLVCDALVNREGETTAYQFYPAVIHSHGRLTYTQVWQALQGEEKACGELGERVADVKRLYALFQVLREARKRRYAMDFESVEAQAVFREDGRVDGFKIREHNDAHRLIEECMLVANVCAAQFVLSKGKTALFRVHPEPENERVAQLAAVLSRYGLSAPRSPKDYAALTATINEKYPYLSTVLLRSMSRASYSPVNIGHYGLQYKAYTHFTSPIRRYPDLLLHRVIRGILTGRGYNPELAFSDEALMSGFHARQLGASLDGKAPAEGGVWAHLGILASSQERRADDATRDVMTYLMCDYAKRRLKSRTLKARVVGIIEAGLFVRLEDSPIEGFVHVSNIGGGWWEYVDGAMECADIGLAVFLGDEIDVRINAVDMDERRLDFSAVRLLTEHKIKVLPRWRRGRRWSGGENDDFGDADDFDWY